MFRAFYRYRMHPTIVFMYTVIRTRQMCSNFIFIYSRENGIEQFFQLQQYLSDEL